MWLENIQLLNFRNYTKSSFDFCRQVNCIVGENGSGKTNLLDAIYYLSFTKSALNPIDQQNVLHGAGFFTVKGKYQKKGKTHRLQCSLQKGEKKIFKHNQKPYKKFKGHIGSFPLVMIAPQDIDLIREGSETRRKFFDSIISQVDRVYLNHLIQYNQNLKQRNSLLHQFQEKNYFDEDLLEPFNRTLLKLALTIYQTRAAFISKFMPLFQKHYAYISGMQESTGLEYISKVAEPEFDKMFKENIQKDLAWGRTTLGIHKDEYAFSIGAHSLKKFGSQGQQKSYLIALKLAQFDFIKEENQLKPLLLLDDIFAKLDEVRIRKMTDLMAQDSFGQIFITDAQPKHIDTLFSDSASMEVKIYHLEKGKTNH